MMKQSEIAEAASVLGDLLMAGESIDLAVKQLIKIQPKYAEFWESCIKAIKNEGSPLSARLGEVWPDYLVGAVRAGEESGKAAEVYRQIETSTDQQIIINEQLGKVFQPLFFLVGGLLVSLGYMLFIVPSLLKATGSLIKEEILIQTISDRLQLIFVENGMVTWSAVGTVLVLAIWWLQEPANRAQLFSLVRFVPVLNKGVENLSYSLWSNYIAIMYAAGIPIDRVITISSQVMPLHLQRGARLMAADIVTKGIKESIQPDSNIENDPRADWPHQFVSAFRIADRSGALDQCLERAAPSLYKIGQKRIEGFLATSRAVILTITAMMLLMPMLAYFMALGAAMQHGLK